MQNNGVTILRLMCPISRMHYVIILQHEHNFHQWFMQIVGLVKAPLGSTWLAALDNADCKQLMNLLEENPCRVVQKGKRGVTVLHAAAMRGCLKLLDQVFDLFQGDNHLFVDKTEGINLSLQEPCKAKGIIAMFGRGNFILKF